MEKKTTSAIHFRTKLLTAIYQMQSALGITDLGQFYHKPLRDSHGTVVLSCILNVKVGVKTIQLITHVEQTFETFCRRFGCAKFYLKFFPFAESENFYAQFPLGAVK